MGLNWYFTTRNFDLSDNLRQRPGLFWILFFTLSVSKIQIAFNGGWNYDLSCLVIRYSIDKVFKASYFTSISFVYPFSLLNLEPDFL